MSWGGANRPTTSSRVENRPGNREGADGDIQIKGTGLGAKLFAKWSGRWWDVPLSIDGVTKIGVTDSDYLSIDRDSVDIYTNSVKVASFGSDISFTGKINITSTATDNICIGKWSSGDPDVGEGNVVIGVDAGNALNSNTDDVVLIGKDAGKAITAADATANYAVAVGPSALATIVAPLQCTAIGYQAMYRGAKSVYNVAVGYRALYGKDTSFWSKYNVAVGTGAMGDADGDTDSVNGAEYNTAIGHHAMKGLIAGNKNVGIGHGALLRVEGNNNVAVGETAGEYITVGNDNICIGKDAGDNITTGSDNVVIGGADVPSATGSDQLSISSGDGGVTWINGNSSGLVGIGTNEPDTLLHIKSDTLSTSSTALCHIENNEDAVDAADHLLFLDYSGDANIHDSSIVPRIISVHDGGGEIGYFTTASDGNINTAWTNVSDKRLKKEIKDTSLEGLNIVNAVKIRDFKWNDKRSNVENLQVIGGFVADELYTVYPYATTGTPDAMKDILDDDGNKTGEEIDAMGVTEGNLMSVMIKAIQELSAKLDTMQTEINTLKAE